MSWEAIAGLTGCAFTVFSALNLWLNNQIRLSITRLEVEIERGRNADKEAMREWVEERYEPRVSPARGRHFASN